MSDDDVLIGCVDAEITTLPYEEQEWLAYNFEMREHDVLPSLAECPPCDEAASRQPNMIAPNGLAYIRCRRGHVRAYRITGRAIFCAV